MARKSCFVVSPIGEKDSEVRKRSDQVLKHLIMPVITSFGYDFPIRSDSIAEPRIIPHQIVKQLDDKQLELAFIKFIKRRR